ncbi:MAG: PAS domain S-box protein, partial [Syntrophales bacterium]|nr:PAS domain S-box protein [Syntrophales bacterium]
VSAKPFESGGRRQFVHIVRDITDRKKTEEALRKANAYNRGLIEVSLDPLVTIGPDGRITDVNAATEAATGCNRAELIGKDFSDYFTEPEKARVGYREVFREGFLREYPLEIRHRDGHVTSVLYNASVYRDEHGQVVGVFAAARDITERKQAEEALRENEARFRTVIEAIQEGITFSDEKGHFEAYNSKMEELTGYSADEANACSDYSACLYPDPQDREKALAGLNELTTTGMSREAETIIRTKDGVQKHVLVSTTVITYKGRKMFLSNYHDITERKLLEEELRTLSIVDELTGLNNRRGFLTLSEQQLKFAERTKKSIVLIFMDLDHLKWINDTFGHQEGDAALVEIAAILRRTFRKSDTIGRMGGDEFAVLAMDTAQEVPKTVSRFLDALDSCNKSETRRYKLSVSMGTAHFDPENPSSLDELIARADDLMYKEKRTKVM